MEQLKDENLRFDWKNYMTLRSGDSIDLAQFDDEAYVARELRLVPGIQVSDDGQYCYRKVPDIFEADLRTIYIEAHGYKLTLETITNKCRPFGEVESIKEFHKYAFVTFKAPESASNMVRDSCYQPFAMDPFLVQDRIMSKQAWNNLMTEYYSLKHVAAKPNINPMKQKAIYEKGTIIHFQNTHPKSNSRIIRQLFELVAPIAFIDYEDQQGYIRFKSGIEANRVLNYFARCNIVQQNGKDATGMLDPYYKQRGIQVRLLQGREEQEYWQYIMEKQHEKWNPQVEMECDYSQHIKFDQDEPENTILNHGKHIKFDDDADIDDSGSRKRKMKT